MMIHHNPMALQSLVLSAKDGEPGHFEVAGVKPIGVDRIIEMRRSGEYAELEGLSAAELTPLLERMLENGHLSSPDDAFVRVLLDDISKQI
ncbi:MAG: hypothetical protein PHS41_03550 [Victivallaceae bacterium]|nr:hypothetical protein [Victivallaceae bacterium]